MTGILRSSAVMLLLGTGLALSCGGKVNAGVQRSDSGGHGGEEQGGQGAGPATHVTECEALCARTADAGCSAGDSACVMLCATVTGFASCQGRIQAWLDCAAAADVVCDASGIPTFSGCDMQLGLAAACAATAPPPKVVEKSCSDYCDQLEAAGCTATTPLGECRQTCGLAGMVVSNCQANFISYLDCAVASGQSCTEDGQLNSGICTSQQLIYTGCVLTAVGKATLTGSGGTAVL